MEILKKRQNFSFIFLQNTAPQESNSKFPSYLQYLTDNRLSSIRFSQDYIAKKSKLMAMPAFGC